MLLYVPLDIFFATLFRLYIVFPFFKHTRSIELKSNMVSFKQVALFAMATGLATVDAQTKTGKTTRYWDCCKGSCGWSGKAAVNQPIQSCDKSDNPLADMAARNGCDSGGKAYMCSNQSPWAVNDNLAYGFAAVKLSGLSESNWCCACYE